MTQLLKPCPLAQLPKAVRLSLTSTWLGLPLGLPLNEAKVGLFIDLLQMPTTLKNSNVAKFLRQADLGLYPGSTTFQMGELGQMTSPPTASGLLSVKGGPK